MKEKLLLLHGALGSKKQLFPLKEKLSDRFEVYTFNFEGHGGRDTQKPLSIELFAKNVIAFLEENEIEQTFIFGYSMGGYVALRCALLIPHKIKKIVTLGTKFDWSEESANKEVRMLNPEKIKEKVPHFAEKLRKDHLPLNWEEVMKNTAAMMLDMGRGNKLHDPDFKKIGVPVTLGVGTRDEMVSYEETEYISKLIPGSRLVRLDGVEHPIDKIDREQLIPYILEQIAG